MTKDSDKSQIAIVGLGYVGLPLAIEFAKKYSVIGYDTNQSRVSDLQNSFDKTFGQHDSPQICEEHNSRT